MDNDRKSFLERRGLSCGEVEELIDSYIDSEMSPPHAARFEQHLERCEYCRALVSDCQHIVSMAKTLSEAPMPPGVSMRLREALRDRVGYDSQKTQPHLTLVKSDIDGPSEG